MYEDLIKRLRERSVFMLPNHGKRTSYDADLLHQAADAIEELSRLNAEITKRRTAGGRLKAR